MMRRCQDLGEQHGTFGNLEGGMEDYGCEKSGEVLEGQGLSGSVAVDHLVVVRDGRRLKVPVVVVRLPMVREGQV